MKKRLFKKVISFTLSFNLLLQSFFPFLVVPVYAEESTPSAEINVTPSSTPEPTPSDTVTLVNDPTPEVTPEPTIVIASDSAAIQEPEITVTPEPAVAPEPTPEATPTAEPTPTEPQNNSPHTESNESSAPSTPTSPPQSLSVTTQLENTTNEISPSLTTDKSDYFPTDTVYVTGTNFLPNTTYTLVVSSLDNPIFIYKPEVTSDANSNLSHSFTLDGNYRPNYTIEALDASGKTLTALTFTDTDLKICHADDSQSNPYVTNHPSKTADAGGHDGHDGTVWYSGIADHAWGDIIPPFSYSSGSFPGQNWTIEGQAIYNNGCHIPADLKIIKTNNLVDAIGTVGQTFVWKLRIDNIGHTDAKFDKNEIIFTDNLPDSNAVYGTPTYVYKDVHEATHIICSVTSATLTCKADNSKDVTIKDGGYLEISLPTTFSTSGIYSNPILGGVCEVDPNNNISELNETNNSCSDTVTINSSKGTLVIKKIVKNDNGGDRVASDFKFSINGADSISFEADGQNDILVDEGNFSITEDEIASYTTTYDKCNDLFVPAGGSAVCTITNDDKPVVISVKKVIIGTPKPYSNFSFKLNDNAPVAFDSNGKGQVSTNAGSYIITEVDDSDYFTEYSDDCSGSAQSGDEFTCTITNTRKTGNLIFDKIVSDGLTSDTSWTFSVFGLSGTYTDGQSVSLNTGTYTITESDDIPGYSLTAVGGACSNREGLSALASVGTGDNTCTFTNTRDTGSVKVNKLVDLNGDGNYSDGNDLGFEWKLNDGNYQTMGTQLNDVPTTIAGSVGYTITEKDVAGYHLVGWSTNGSCIDPIVSTPIKVTVIKNQVSTVTICNVRDITPSLQITKANNASGSLFAGNSVEYRIKVKISKNGVENLTVTDLPPEGFKYRLGSYKVYMNGVINPLIAEPVYHSPGVWNLGSAKDGDEFELVYLTDIDSAQDPGTYKDLVWAKGDSYLAQVPSADASYVNDIFAGTQVTIDKSLEKSIQVEVEKKTEGQVLGATTTLPATGANEIWLMLAALLIGAGSFSIYYGIKKNHE